MLLCPGLYYVDEVVASSGWTGVVVCWLFAIPATTPTNNTDPATMTASSNHPSANNTLGTLGTATNNTSNTAATSEHGNPTNANHFTSNRFMPPG